MDAGEVDRDLRASRHRVEAEIIARNRMVTRLLGALDDAFEAGCADAGSSAEFLDAVFVADIADRGLEVLGMRLEIGPGLVEIDATDAENRRDRLHPAILLATTG